MTYETYVISLSDSDANLKVHSLSFVNVNSFLDAKETTDKIQIKNFSYFI